MKRTTLVTAFAITGFLANAQQWGGPTTSTAAIFRTGIVGIGNGFSTSNIAQAQLHLRTNGSIYPFMLESNATGGQNNVLNMYFSSAPAAGITLGNGSFVFQANNPNGTADMLFMPNTTTAGFVLKSNGWFGLGTTSPTEKLHVHNGAIRISGQGSQGGPMLLFGGATNNFGDWGVEYMPNTQPHAGLNFWKPFGSNGTSGNHFLFLSDNGRIGVNTDNATAQLTVNGNMLVGDPGQVSLPFGYKLYVQTGILTEKVKVALTTSIDWADYVFAKDYELKPLEEVKTFVMEHKHLPNVPSAEELVKDGGIDLGKMDAKLMEKIEELTLYVIELNEKNKELAARIKQLEASTNK